MSARPRPLGRPRPAPPPQPRLAPSPPPLPPAPHNAQCTGAGELRAAPEPQEPATRPSSPLPLPDPSLGVVYRPSVSMATASPATASPIPLTNQCACVSVSCRAALPSATLRALRAGLGSISLAQKLNADPVGTRCSLPSLPASRNPVRDVARLLLTVPRPVPDGCSHLPLTPARAALPGQAPTWSVASLISAAPCSVPACVGGWQGRIPKGRAWSSTGVWGLKLGARSAPPDPCGVCAAHFLSLALPDVRCRDSTRKFGVGSGMDVVGSGRG